MRHLFIHEGRLYQESEVGETREEGAIFYSGRWRPSMYVGHQVPPGVHAANPVPLPEGCELVPPEEYGPTDERIPEDYFRFNVIRGEWESQASALARLRRFVWRSGNFFARPLPRWKRIFHGYEPPVDALESPTRVQRVMRGYECNNEACDDRPSNLEWAQGIGASAPPPPPIAMDDAAGDDVARDLTNEELVAFRRQNPTSTKE